ncbi:TPA: hypothetical protein RU610_003993 [Salmonella enterica]|nr:hypothetical protein [Salmonella enterica]HEA0268048.1 hypothetical protein [Salmonella enterica]HEA0294987.1 hypothetical protein [Salmonella enterica]HEA0336380.1 hypothetical protein [Salmonella enterica]HEA0383618.1 hypothetical protein [Salmonella enterica]
MKKSLIALLLITSASSYADKIPVSIENVIAGTNAREHSLKNGELTVRYDRSKVTQDMATAMFDWICRNFGRGFNSRQLHHFLVKQSLLKTTKAAPHKGCGLFYV